MSIAYDVLDSIGNTPLIELRKIFPPGPARIVARLEWANPTGSMQDRMRRSGHRVRRSRRAPETGRNGGGIQRGQHGHLAGAGLRRERLRPGPWYCDQLNMIYLPWLARLNSIVSLNSRQDWFADVAKL